MYNLGVQEYQIRAKSVVQVLWDPVMEQEE